MNSIRNHYINENNRLRKELTAIRVYLDIKDQKIAELETLLSEYAEENRSLNSQVNRLQRKCSFLKWKEELENDAD